MSESFWRIGELSRVCFKGFSYLFLFLVLVIIKVVRYSESICFLYNVFYDFKIVNFFDVSMRREVFIVYCYNYSMKVNINCMVLCNFFYKYLRKKFINIYVGK